MPKVEDALELLNQGLSVFPLLPGTKEPPFSWKEYQTRLATEDEIRDLWEKYPDANIGIATGIVSNLCVIDIDTDEGFDVIKDYVPEELSTPAVRTPKGGQHLYFRCNNESLRNNSRALPGIDFRANGGYVVAPPSVNGSGHMYIWEVPLSVDRPELPDAYVQHLTMSLSIDNTIDNKTLNSFDLSEGRRNEVLFHLAYTSFKGGSGYGFTKDLVTKVGTDAGLNRSELDKIITSAYQRALKKDRNISLEVENWLEIVTDCDFSVTDCYRDLEVVTSCDKAAVRKALSRLKDLKKIVQVGKKGVYRKVNEEIEYIDIFKDAPPPLGLRFPLNIETFFEAQQGNIMIISGEQNAGKTGFALEFMEKNHSAHKIQYMSSEMSQGEFRNRIQAFDLPLKSWNWKNITLLNRSENFADLIKDDGRIYICDFIEIYDEFYKIGAQIKDIWTALNGKGAALICLQKSGGSDYGRGGSFTLEKPRLGINLDRSRDGQGNICRLSKVKNWAPGVTSSPDWLECRYKLVQGHKFMQCSEWDYPTPKVGGKCVPGTKVPPSIN